MQTQPRLNSMASFTLHGIPVSRGIAIGRAHLLAPAAHEIKHELVSRSRGGNRSPAPEERDRHGAEGVADDLEGAAARFAGRTGRLHRRPCADPVGPDGGRIHREHHPPPPLQRRMGAADADRRAVGAVRRNRGRLPARAQGRHPAGRRTGAESAGRHRPRAAEKRPRWRRGGGARDRRRARHFAGRHAAIPQPRLFRFRHRPRRTEFAYRDRRPQPRHSGRGRHGQCVGPDPGRRLADHRRRCRRRHRRSAAAGAGAVPRMAGAPAAHPQEARQAEKDRQRHARRHADHLAGEYRAAGGLRGGDGSGRRRHRPVPLRIPVHGPHRPRPQAAVRGRAVRGLPQGGAGDEGAAGDDPHHRHRRRQAAR